MINENDHSDDSPSLMLKIEEGYEFDCLLARQNLSDSSLRGVELGLTRVSFLCGEI